ncbi:hypothetical protein EYF80_050759 [Liparis tanakae]|uniref:Uncharacterized protein n=1 Tax=Liparis tanakae TaxID=230148 RepID=A0A4Z2FD05_9TELE|nr:hypothetical protein EYF80_050759 [Liparis tanakae]
MQRRKQTPTEADSDAAKHSPTRTGALVSHKVDGESSARLLTRLNTRRNVSPHPSGPPSGRSSGRAEQLCR